MGNRAKYMNKEYELKHDEMLAYIFDCVDIALSCTLQHNKDIGFGTIQIPQEAIATGLKQIHDTKLPAYEKKGG